MQKMKNGPDRDQKGEKKGKETERLVNKIIEGKLVER